MLKKYALFLTCTLATLSLFAEKKVDHQTLIWYAYVQHLKINDRFTVSTDVQERHFVAPLKQSQFVMRSVFRTTIKNNWDLGPGFCFFISNTDPTADYDLQVPEVRPFIEANNRQAFKRVNISHRYRLEARFFKNSSGPQLEDGFSFGSMRFRYQFGLDIFLKKSDKNIKHALTLRIMDELMLNFGKKVTYNIFDQNRVGVALQYAPIKQIGIEVGYINWFQQRTSGDKFFDRNIFRLGIVHHIHLKQKDKSSGSTKL